MSTRASSLPSLAKLGKKRRQSVADSQAEWVETQEAFPGENPTLLVRPAVDGIDLVAWGRNNRDLVSRWLVEHGAILFRGFDSLGLERFEEFIAAVSGGAVEYSKRAGPRRQVSGHIYSSTDYPHDQTIFPHNEGGFQPEFPTKIFFYCSQPASEGGETPIGDNRWIARQIPAELKSRFAERGIMYVRNFGTGFGLPWETAFQTHDRSEVEKWCRANGVACEWYPAPGDGQCVRTRVVGPAFVRHPVSGEAVWFNHATFFHITTLPETIRTGLLEEFAEDCLPNHTFYGDGSSIELDVAEQLRGHYLESLVDHAWQHGDVLAVDNLLTVHGRRPFRGERKIVVGLADPCHWRDLGLYGREYEQQREV